MERNRYNQPNEPKYEAQNVSDDEDNMNDSLHSKMRIINNMINIKYREMQTDCYLVLR